ncbi:integrase core domain-containing protein [Porphyromonas sp.]
MSSEEQTFEEAMQVVARAVEMYNTARPHQNLEGKNASATTSSRCSQSARFEWRRSGCSLRGRRCI